MKDHIDLVVSIDKIPTTPLEIKLTVIPDNGTATYKKSEWAPEIVMRPVSSAHAMMGVAHSLLQKENKALKDRVIQELKPSYNKIQDWNNATELIKHAKALHDALRSVLQISEPLQKPFLVQPIWQTQGQSFVLQEQCFDVFVWSDVSVMGIPVQEYVPGERMTRFLREIARHVRSLLYILLHGDFDYTGIYKQMSYDIQTDRAFAISGKSSIKYLRHTRLSSPVLARSVLSELILNGGESHLKPERRFDAALQAQMMR